MRKKEKLPVKIRSELKWPHVHISEPQTMTLAWILTFNLISHHLQNGALTTETLIRVEELVKSFQAPDEFFEQRKERILEKIQRRKKSKLN
jgi:hypothetical protein